MLWRTSDGQNIRIKDMEDRHLLNALRWLLERRVEARRLDTVFPGKISGVFAGRWEQKWKPYLEAMEAECALRDLNTSHLTPERIRVVVAKRQLATMPSPPRSALYEPPKRLVRKEE